MKKILKEMNLFEWFLIIGISLLNIAIAFINKDNNIIGLISSITGVICVVMTAKGHISCYHFGIINIITYVIIAFGAKLYGEVILNVLYFFPTQFIGLYFWKKNRYKNTNIVKAKKITTKEMIIYMILTIIGAFGYGYILKLIGSNQPFVNAATTVLSLEGMYLSIKRFKEQWIMWILIDVMSIYMWTIAVLNGEANSLVILMMWVVYLINAFYGYINWLKMEKKV